jgi:hypothetical protein
MPAIAADAHCMYVPPTGTHAVPQGTPSVLPGAVAALVGAALIVVMVPFLWPLAEHFNPMAHEGVTGVTGVTTQSNGYVTLSLGALRQQE